MAATCWERSVMESGVCLHYDKRIKDRFKIKIKTNKHIKYKSIHARSKIILKQNNLLFGTIDTWLLWNLTEKQSHLTDITNASRTMLFDLKKEKWSKILLQLLNIPLKILPQVTPNSYNFGSTKLFCSSEISLLFSPRLIFSILRLQNKT